VRQLKRAQKGTASRNSEQRPRGKIYRLISRLSHDLRTPLTILKGEMEVALLRDRKPEEYRALLRSNLEEVERISRLVDDIMIVIRGEAGELKLVLEPAALDGIILEILDRYKKNAADRGIDLTMFKKSGIICKLDRNRLGQVFLILIENALNYTPERGRVEVRVEGRGKEAWVLVRDQGIGIPEEELASIFEPFYRGEKAKRIKPKGFGLSLSAARHIVEAHNGEISAENNLAPEPGATFKVRLPLTA